VGPLQSQLDHHDVAADVDLIELTVHVGEGPVVVLDLYGELVGPLPGDTDDSSVNVPSAVKAAAHEAMSMSSAILYARRMTCSLSSAIVVLLHLIVQVKTNRYNLRNQVLSNTGPTFVPVSLEPTRLELSSKPSARTAEPGTGETER
jgi:hypothetical protein